MGLTFLRLHRDRSKLAGQIGQRVSDRAQAIGWPHDGQRRRKLFVSSDTGAMLGV
jgi:hypothetical protein